MELEIQAREPEFDRIKENAEKMMASDHFASAQITESLIDLLKLVQKLKSIAEIRGQKLRDALQSQQYYAEANEAEQWMRDRIPSFVLSTSLGDDQDTAQSLLRKLDIVEKDVELHRTEINRLQEMVQIMVNRKHFDGPQLTAKQSKMEKDFSDLKIRCRIMRTNLIDAERYL